MFAHTLKRLTVYLSLVIIFVFAISLSLFFGNSKSDADSFTNDVAYADGPGTYKKVFDKSETWTLTGISDSEITSGKNGLPNGVYGNTTTSFEDAKKYFSFYSDSSNRPSADDLKCNTAEKNGIGLRDFDPGGFNNQSDYSFVYWIDIKFDGQMLQAVKNGNVKFSFSCSSNIKPPELLI